MKPIRFDEKSNPGCGPCASHEVPSLEGRAYAQPPAPTTGQLHQWPVQLKLVPASAPYFDGADLLVAADCTAYAYGDFHRDFIRGRVTLVGCPKLDAADYSETLASIFTENDIHSITLTRMMVPCCGGMELAVKKAIAASGKAIPLRIATISPAGEIVNERLP